MKIYSWEVNSPNLFHFVFNKRRTLQVVLILNVNLNHIIFNIIETEMLVTFIFSDSISSKKLFKVRIENESHNLSILKSKQTVANIRQIAFHLQEIQIVKINRNHLS